MPERHIVALGGGGFSDDGPQSPLDDFILSLARKPQPQVCFIATASGDPDTYVANFFRAFSPRDCRPTELGLFRRTIVDLERFIMEQDVLYVGGGNTANMLAIWRTHGLDRILRDAWQQGTVLAGVSAGAICWFEACVTDSYGLELSGLRDGLGFLPGSACPHYNSETRRRPVYRDLVGNGFPGGFAIDDGVGLHFEDTRLTEVVSSMDGRRAYELKLDHGQVVEHPIQPRSLR